MATTLNKKCSICNTETDTYICTGCSNIFCFNHLTEHRDKIKQQYQPIEDSFKLFEQILNQKKTHSNKHPLIEKINQWENDSIEKIKQIANECKQKLISYTSDYLIKIQSKLNDLFEQLQRIRLENKCNNTDLEQLKSKLNRLKEKIDKPTNISIEEEKSAEFINRINIIILPIGPNTKWKQNAITIAGGNDGGNQLSQLCYPWGICLDDDNHTIYIADYGNNRIIEWKLNATNGRVVAGGNGRGNQLNQLNSPRDVIINKINNSLIISDQGNRRVIEWSRENGTNSGEVIISDIDCWGLALDKSGDLYVSNHKENEIRRWKKGEKEGTIVAGGNGKGSQLNQLHYPRYIFIDDDFSLYVSDFNNNRIMKWIKDAKEGIIVAGGNGKGDDLTQLSGPRGITIDQVGQIYIADSHNDRIMRWYEGDKQGSIIIGGKGQGKQTNQLSSPIGLTFDRQGNLYVVDNGNHRVEKFEKS